MTAMQNRRRKITIYPIVSGYATQQEREKETPTMHARMPNRSELARGRAAPEDWARIDPTVYVTAARRLQAQATAEAIGAGWRGIGRGLTGLAGLARRHLLEPLARRAQRRRAHADLAAMDDRLLADIGLRRADIQLALTGRLADPRVTARAPGPAAIPSDRPRAGEQGPAAPTANSDRRPASAQPERHPDLAA
jgi:uncharacterized protein YjiS (DUF1127 family)